LTDSIPVPFFYAWYQNAAIITSFSFVKRCKETVFYGLNTGAANEFVCIDRYNSTSNVIVPSKGVPWTIDDSISCVKIGTDTNNNWVIQISANGNQIEDSLELSLIQ